MKTSILLPLTALLTTAFSSPTKVPRSMHISMTETAFWPVTNFTCPSGSPAGCVYGFNISYTPDPADTSSFLEPAFSTFCNGTNIQGEFKPCQDPSVVTNVINGWQNSTLIVQHKWYEDLGDGSKATVWIEGNYTWVLNGTNGYQAPSSFHVKQTSQYAIA